MVDRLIPASIADERFTALDQIAGQRFDALPVTAVLVYALDSVDVSALPALAWQFGALGPTWQHAADETAKRALIRRVLYRRRHRGTHFAVRDALDTSGLRSFVRDGLAVPIKYNGQWRHNGTVRHRQPPAWLFWVVVVGEPSTESKAAIESIVREWQRASVRFDLFWVDTEELLQETTEYHRVA